MSRKLSHKSSEEACLSVFHNLHRTFRFQCAGTPFALDFAARFGARTTGKYSCCSRIVPKFNHYIIIRAIRVAPHAMSAFRAFRSMLARGIITLLSGILYKTKQYRCHHKPNGYRPCPWNVRLGLAGRRSRRGFIGSQLGVPSGQLCAVSVVRVSSWSSDATVPLLNVFDAARCINVVVDLGPV